MLEAEPDIVAQRVARLWRRIMRFGHTSLSLAQPRRPGGLLVGLLVSLGIAGHLDLWSGGASHSLFHIKAMPLAGNLNPRGRR